MPDAITLADTLASAVENSFTSTYGDQIEALVAVRAAMGPDQRSRLLASLHQLGEQATNVCAAISRDAAW